MNEYFTHPHTHNPNHDLDHDIIKTHPNSSPIEHSSRKKPGRESSMELLRIVAMTMIVIHHFLIHGIKPENLPDNLYYLLDPFFLIGVNLFFLISGYFKVKFSLKGILKFTFVVFFFGVVNLFLLYFFNNYVSLSEVVRLILFPISSSPYWFLSVYFILIIISPVLNFFIDNLMLSQYNKFLIIFSFITIYSCGLGYNYSAHFGYSLIQCIYLYFVASYLRINKDLFKNKSKYAFLITFILLTVANSIFSYNTPNSPYFRNYNGIFILMSSFSLFIFFTRVKFKSIIINSIASAALGCYLLQDGHFGQQFFYSYMNEVYLQSSNLAAVLLNFSGIFIGFWILSWILTKIENLWSVPLINFIYDKIPKKIKSLFDLNLQPSSPYPN